MKTPISIDLQEFIAAMQMIGENMYLNKKNGKIYANFDDGFSEEDFKGEKYILIDQIPSCESFKIMEDFIHTLKSQQIRTILSIALEKHSPFRNFKDALYDYPRIQKQWFTFEEEKKKKIAEDFLEENAIVFKFH